jgi:hypothetical protein
VVSTNFRVEYRPRPVSFLGYEMEGHSMETLVGLLNEFRKSHGGDWYQPEYRGLEMYSAKKRSAPCADMQKIQKVQSDAAFSGKQTMLLSLQGLWSALTLLEACFSQQQPQTLEGVTSWQRYQQLPKKQTADKIIAETYRLLRIVRVAWLHPEGQIVRHAHAIELCCNSNQYPLILKITETGLSLLQSLVFYFLNRPYTRYGEAYHDAMLQSYFTDLVGELRGFEDEDRALCQFRPGLNINRHWRLDCENPRYQVTDGFCVIQLNPRFDDGGCHPIDFHLRLNDRFYVVPMEALTPFSTAEDKRLINAISLSALDRWECRSSSQHLEIIHTQSLTTQCPPKDVKEN